jgi:hypothetical protein
MRTWMTVSPGHRSAASPRWASTADETAAEADENAAPKPSPPVVKT